jgi:hypothetical protein
MESAPARKNMRFFKYSEIHDADTFFMFLKALLKFLSMFFNLKFKSAYSNNIDYKELLSWNNQSIIWANILLLWLQKCLWKKWKKIHKKL